MMTKTIALAFAALGTVAACTDSKSGEPMDPTNPDPTNPDPNPNPTPKTTDYTGKYSMHSTIQTTSKEPGANSTVSASAARNRVLRPTPRKRAAHAAHHDCTELSVIPVTSQSHSFARWMADAPIPQPTSITRAPLCKSATRITDSVRLARASARLSEPSQRP